MNYVGIRIKRVFVMILCIFSIFSIQFMPGVSKACWVSMTVEELTQNSDVILIGEINGDSWSIKGKVISKWYVKVKYLVKGEVEGNEVSVVTPNEKTSLHYELDEWGKQVLLFLRKSDEYYEPLTPQAVVPVRFDSGNFVDTVKSITIVDERINFEDKGRLENYIKTFGVEGPGSQTGSNADKTLRMKYTLCLFLTGPIILFCANIYLTVKVKRNKRE